MLEKWTWTVKVRSIAAGRAAVVQALLRNTRGLKAKGINSSRHSIAAFAVVIFIVQDVTMSRARQPSSETYVGSSGGSRSCSLPSATTGDGVETQASERLLIMTEMP
jgi:hypothetical protein